MSYTALYRKFRPSTFEEVKETWNGVLSVARIVKHFEDI